MERKVKFEETLNPIELEHVIGFAGQYSKSLCPHPKDPSKVLIAMGCNVVIQDLEDDHSQSFLQGHDEPVSVVVASANGTFVASGQEGSTRLAVPEADVIVWDLAQKMDVYRLRGIRGRVTCLAFSEDEVFLAACGKDGSVFVWDMQTGEMIGSMGTALVGTTLTWGPIRQGSHSRRPEYELFATVGHQVKAFRLVYSVGNMQYQVTESAFKLPAGMIRDHLDSCLSPCGQSLLLCTSIGDVNVYQIESLIFRASFPACSGGARALCSVGPFVFVGGGDGTVKRLTGSHTDWRLDLEVSLPGSVSALSGFLDRDGRSITLFAGTAQGQIYIIDGSRMKVIREIITETAPVVAAAFKATCSIRFATLSSRGIVRVWDLSDYSVVAQGSGPRGDEGLCLLFDQFDDHVIAGFKSGFVRAFCAKKGPSAGQLEWEIAHAHRDGVSALCATNLFYATGGERGGVRLWSRASKSQLFEFSDHINKPVTGLLPDVRQAHLLHSCGMDRSVYTYDLKKERRMVHHAWNRDGVFTSMTQRLDSENELVTAGTDGRLLTWDFDVPEPVAQVSATNQRSGAASVAFTSVQVSPSSGQYIAASASDSRIRIWDLRTGELVATSPMLGFTQINSIAWSPDEKQLVSVGLDKCICVWNFYALTSNDQEQSSYK